jgi:hypothetical protein
MANKNTYIILPPTPAPSALNASTTDVIAAQAVAVTVSNTPVAGQTLVADDEHFASWKTKGANAPVVSLFYALMPPDNSATIAAGAPVLFPGAGPTNGAATTSGPGQFNLPLVGTYHIVWQCSIDEACQLGVSLNGTLQAYTVVGRATGTNQIVGDTLIETTLPNTLLSIVNPVGNPAALTMTSIAGGTHQVAATLTIWLIS